MFLASEANLDRSTPPVDRTAALPRPSLTYRIVWLAGALLVGTAYFWVIGLANPAGRFAWNSDLDGFYHLPGHPTVAGSRAIDGYYDLLGRAFAEGELRLPIEPAPELLRYPDPFSDPSSWPWRMMDLALYHGHYYLYHGPTPALLLFTPWRLATGRDFPENFAAFLLAFGAYLFLAALFRRVFLRGSLRVPPSIYALMLLALGLGQGVPFLLNRTKVYEVAIASGWFCLSAGFYLLFHGVTAPRRNLAVILLSGISFGLAIGSRPHLGLAALCALGMLLAARRLPACSRIGRRDILAFAAPVFVCGLAIAAYNFARFDNPFEFGTRYLLGDSSYQHVRPALKNFLPGLYYLLICPPKFEMVFPFVRLAFRGSFHFLTSSFLAPWRPGRYFLEPTAGVLTLSPIVLLAPLAILKRKWRSSDPIIHALLGAMTIAATGIILFTATLPMSSQRFEVDFLPFLVFVGCVAAAQIWAGQRNPRNRLALTGVLAVALSYATLANLGLAVQGQYDQFVQMNPQEYVRLARWFSPVAKYMPLFNPGLHIEADFDPRAHCPNSSEPLVSTGEFGSRYMLSAECSEDGHLRLISQSSVQDSDVRSAELPASGIARLELTYTPADNMMTIRWNRATVIEQRLRFLVTAPSQVYFGWDPSVGDRSRFTGRIFASRARVDEAGEADPAPGGFRNPLLPAGPDPWVIFHGGFYYYMNTTARNLTIWKTRDLTRLASAEKKVVWRPPLAGPYSHDIWAPELHFLSGKWYIYFAADDGRNATHRIWVIENASPDPLSGSWVLKGKVSDPSDRWASDPTVFEIRGELWMAWSGWPGDGDGEQDIYLARLRNPWSVSAKRALVSSPQYEWERGEPNPNAPELLVNDSPEALIHNGRVFLTYSAGACWEENSKLGILRARADADLMNSSSWFKSSLPAFASAPEAGIFGVGLDGFFKSPDGQEDWMIYHARSQPGEGCGDRRSPRIQSFAWQPDGTPEFGVPISVGTAISKPAGLK